MPREQARKFPNLTVRLREDVEVFDGYLVGGSQAFRLSKTAHELLRQRSVSATSRIGAVLAARLMELNLGEPLVNPARNGLKRLTVIVPVEDNADGVNRLLGELGRDVQCIVVDDASTDSERLAEVARRHHARLVHLETNQGPANARNEGVKQVTTPFVAFVDSDVLVSAETLASLVDQFGDPGLAAVAPRVVQTGGRRWFQRYEETNGSLDMGQRSAYVTPGSHVTYVPSACLLARIDMLDRGFDSNLRSGEDVDLVWRLQNAGHRVRYVAGLRAWHEPRNTVTSWLGRKAFYGSSGAELADRHGDRVAPAVLSLPSAISIFGLLALRRTGLLAYAAGVAWPAAQAIRMPLPLKSRRSQTVKIATGPTAQAAGLVLRHWWPVSLLLCVFSSRARRSVAFMAVADGVVAHHRSGSKLRLVPFVLAHRLDDLAYGGGLWWGAIRRGSPRCLLPRWTPTNTRKRKR